MSNKSGAAQQAISLPKGGGAIKGIGETFQANPFSGTGTHSIPIATSPGRNGFGPSLSVQYSAGKGNGIFGLGWELSVPSVTRKTEKGLPQYNEADVFVLSGAEDLVPYLKKIVDPTTNTVTWYHQDPIPHPTHDIIRYRPRTEGLFARIERWTNKTTGEIYWRAITKDNITSIYGRSPEARLSDPDNPFRVYQWLLEESHDAFGNYILYEYAADDPLLYSHEEPALGLSHIFETNRKATQLYIRRIYYGNLSSPLVDEQGSPITYSNGVPVGVLRDGRRHAFEVVFDYGDWDLPTRQPHPDPPPPGRQELFGPDPSVSSQQNPVPVREDRFSTFRAGFEIRTLRRCRRVLMFHHFAELGGPTLVRSTDFTYQTDPDTRLSLLSEVTVANYRKDGEHTYRSAAMPPVTFGYTQFRPHEQRYQSIEARGDDMPSPSLKNPDVALVDLFGAGLPDVVISGPDGMRYWRNLGGGILDRPRPLSHVPAAVAFNQAGVGFGDIGGDGRTDLLVHSSPLPGFYETTAKGTWQAFKPYRSFPSFDLANPNVRLVDLTGDGRSDALTTEPEHFAWYECLGEEGFAPPRYISRRHDLDLFPDVFFDDPAGRVRLADMTGDGLHDVVLVHNGRVDYWPNMGYGRFGRRITMANAPRLGADFDPKRLFLADLTGTGCADLIYVDFDRVHFWFNQSGNVWSNRETILGTPPATDAAAIQFADVFGTGTATLVWSEDFAGQPESHYKALDFCGGIKPYVLNEMNNNMGATTKVRFAPSTKCFLEDLANGSPWITSLPFPVQVVDTVEVIDHVSRTKLVTTYKYHHGYYDGREREFRGFGRVDQFDTETFESFTQAGLHGSGASFLNGEATYYVPPVETRSWFHTGAYAEDESRIGGTDRSDYRDPAQKLRDEFYQGDTEADPLADHDIGNGEDRSEAYRCLRGSPLRTEVYAHDGTAKSDHPYQVTENRYRVHQVQPASGAYHGVYITLPMESLGYHYERIPADPRVSHDLTLEVDEFGHPLRTLAIGYGRRQPDPGLPTEADREKQARAFMTYTANRYTNEVDDPPPNLDHYRAPVLCETETYELTGFTLPTGQRRFSWHHWTADGFARLDQAVALPYEAVPDPLLECKRLIQHERILCRKNDLTGLLPLGMLESLGLPGERYALAFTPGLLAHVYGDRVTDGMLSNEGGYVRLSGSDGWWVPSGRAWYSLSPSDGPSEELAFAQRHFFAPHRSLDPFGNTATVSYDPYDFLPVRTVDAVGNHVTADYDYRLLLPYRVTDPNGNRTEVAFDTLGFVAGTAVMGKTTESVGDSLSGFTADLTEQERAAFVSDPVGHAAGLLQRATTRVVYDLGRYRLAGRPVVAAVLARETHATDPLPSDGLKVQVAFGYSDGFGREIQRKLQAEPGGIRGDGPVVHRRWVCNGWTIFDNKGNAVTEYEPFFDDTPEFRFNRREGVGSTRCYDPLGRPVALLHPNHTWEKVVFDPWRQETWDANDTASIADPRTDPDVGGFFRGLPEQEYLPTWFAQRHGGAMGAHEQHAADRTAMHAATPALSYTDSLGRSVLMATHNRFERNGNPVEEHYVTRTALDIEGNQREVIDARQRLLMRFDYDMLGRFLHQAGMESGERWLLKDIGGNPIYSWDNRLHRLRTLYDPLRRPTDNVLHTAGGAEQLIGRTVYGESLPGPEGRNQRGRAVQAFDQSGVVTTDAYDFKGNLLEVRRRLAVDYKTTLDWSTGPALEAEEFVTRTAYDALNRPFSSTAPDGSVSRATFNEANLLVKLDVNLGGEPAATTFVADVAYDARGRRLSITYGNGAATDYRYDPLAFRLSHVATRRGSDLLQDLTYTYDPVANIVHIHDDAQQTLYFNNHVVAAHNDFVYDAAYRLNRAEGREHIGQTGQPETTWNDEFRVKLPHPQHGQAMRRYTERYEYDAAGNFERLIHQAADGNWTRSYGYEEASALETGKHSNRLSRTIVGKMTGDLPPESYGYDAHGNLQRMAHLPRLEWDFTDRLRRADLAGGGEVFYVYAAQGQRVRKTVEKNGGTLIEERISLGGFDVFRERRNGAVTLERRSLHVMDDEQRIALVDTRTVGDDGSPARAIRYQFGNHIGSVSLELDESAQLISYEEYYPYGSTSYQAGRREQEVSRKRYRYTGMERDEETGLSYHTARYYAPWLGRWINCDPAGLAGGLNLFAYAHNSPILFVDPSGHQPVLPEPTDAKVVRWLYKERERKHKRRPHRQGDRKRTRAKSRTRAGSAQGIQGGVEGGTGTKLPTSRITEEGAGDGLGGLGEPGDVGTGTDVGAGTTGTGTPTGTDTGSGSTPKDGTDGGTGTKTGDDKQTPTGQQEGDSGSGTGEGSDLDTVTALASLIIDPESLARKSGEKGNGSPVGSSFGFITGWLAKGLTWIMAFGAWAKAGLKKVLGKLKGGIQKLRNKLGGLFKKGPPRPPVPPQTGWRNVQLSHATPDELQLVDDVLNANDVLVGRTGANGTGTAYAAMNANGSTALVLDDWLKAKGLPWSQRWQDVYNRALYERAAAGRPVQIMAGGPYTRGEAAAAEAGAKAGGITNIPFWP